MPGVCQYPKSRDSIRGERFWDRPDRILPEFVNSQLGELVPNPLVQLAGMGKLRRR